MATTYVPKARASIVAARLKQDLIAGKGDWVTIDDDNNIRSFTDIEFRSVYSVGAAEAAPVAPVAAADAPDPMPRKTRGRRAPTVMRAPRAVRIAGAPPRIVDPQTHRNVENIMNTQAGRFFWLLRSFGRPMTAPGVRSIVPAYDNPKSVSAALSLLLHLGYVTKGMRLNSHALWSPTQTGCEAFDRSGAECFTRYGLPVPPAARPDAAAAPPAVAPAAAPEPVMPAKVNRDPLLPAPPTTIPDTSLLVAYKPALSSGGH